MKGIKAFIARWVGWLMVLWMFAVLGGVAWLAVNLQERTIELANASAGRSLAETQLQETKRMLVDQTATADALENDLEGSRANIARLGQDLEAAETQARGQQQRLEELGQDLTALTAQHEGLRREHSDLQQLGGTVQSLETRVEGLAARVEELSEEIVALEERRRPLIIGQADTILIQFRCTGSMEPALTCLDSPTFLTDFRPEDVKVGALIAFDPNCWEEEAGGTWTVHRVSAVEVRDGVHHYWPRGDANEGDDGCWVPHTQVLGYLIDVARNAVPENAQLRDSVNAAKDAYRQARDAYFALRDQHCQRSEICSVPTPIYNELTALRQAGDAAWDVWACWRRNALESEYPGHIPHEC